MWRHLQVCAEVATKGRTWTRQIEAIWAARGRGRAGIAAPRTAPIRRGGRHHAPPEPQTRSHKSTGGILPYSRPFDFQHSCSAARTTGPEEEDL